MMPSNPRVYVASIGFDTKFQMRSLVNMGRENVDLAVAVYPLESDERVARALHDLEEFSRKIMDLDFNSIGVDVDDVAGSIAEIYGSLAGLKPRKVYGDLSGGMRILVLILYSTLTILNRINSVPVEFIVWKEDLSRKLELPVGLDRARILDDLEEGIISQAEVAKTLDELAALTGRPRTTVYVRLQRMYREGLISMMRMGRSVYYSSTILGKLSLYITRKWKESRL